MIRKWKKFLWKSKLFCSALLFPFTHCRASTEHQKKQILLIGYSEVNTFKIWLIVWLMSKGGTENPGFCYWLVSFNNIAINLSQYFTNNLNASILFLSECMGSFTVRVRLAKHVDCQDNCKLLSLNACCTYMCMI